MSEQFWFTMIVWIRIGVPLCDGGPIKWKVITLHKKEGIAYSFTEAKELAKQQLGLIRAANPFINHSDVQCTIRIEENAEQ